VELKAFRLFVVDGSVWLLCFIVAVGLHNDSQEGKMLYTLAVILLIAWLLGVVGTYTIGAFVHVLLVIGLVLLVLGVLSGRRTVV
jgi:hypothetical protein